MTTISKETSILLILLFFVHYGSRLPRRRFWTLLGVQAALYVAVKAVLAYRFRDNPGGMLETQIAHNLYLSAFTPGGFVALVAVGVVVAHDWRAKPPFLRNGMLMLAPLVLLCLFCGFLDEYRAYYETYPVVLALCGHGIAKALDVRPFGVRAPAELSSPAAERPG